LGSPFLDSAYLDASLSLKPVKSLEKARILNKLPVGNISKHKLLEYYLRVSLKFISDVSNISKITIYF